MKAKEYFQKYDDAIWEESHDPAVHTDGPISKLFIDLSVEMKEILLKRNAKTNNAVDNVIREMNDKWNAIGRMFTKKYGESPLKENGFRIGMYTMLEANK